MAINRSIFKNQEISLKSKNILIAGDSHPQRSLNPKYFSSAQNISQSAEPYVLTYWKLKKIFESSVPDTLLLGISPHSISAYNDFKFSDDTWSNEMFMRSYAIEEFDGISNEVPIDYKNYYKTLWKQTAFYPRKNHINFIGDYSNTNKSDVSNWQKPIYRHYYLTDEHINLNEKELSWSKAQVNHLVKIKDLCDEMGVSFILVSHPLHKDYLDNIPSGIMTKYANLMKDFGRKYSVIDMMANEYPDRLFLNVDHLNESGAERFTKEVIGLLKRK